MSVTPSRNSRECCCCAETPGCPGLDPGPIPEPHQPALRNGSLISAAFILGPIEDRTRRAASGMTRVSIQTKQALAIGGESEISAGRVEGGSSRLRCGREVSRNCRAGASPHLAPESARCGLSSSARARHQRRKTWMLGTSPSMTARRGHRDASFLLPDRSRQQPTSIRERGSPRVTLRGWCPENLLGLACETRRRCRP